MFPIASLSACHGSSLKDPLENAAIAVAESVPVESKRWKDRVTRYDPKDATTACLDLSGRKLRTLRVILYISLNPTSLDISNNSLAELPPAFGLLATLQRLNLSKNKLVKLPSNFTLLTALQVLNVSDNKLTVVPLDLCNLTSLQDLNLSNNSLARIPEKIGNLCHLETLVLCDNHLVVLPKKTINLQALTALHIGGNQFDAFPAVVATCGKLAKLYAQHNGMKWIASSINQMANLEILDLSNNYLTVLPTLGGHPRLKSLDLRNNCFKHFPISPSELPPTCVLQLDAHLQREENEGESDEISSDMDSSEGDVARVWNFDDLA